MALRNNILLFFLIILIIVSCKNNSDVAGYKKTTTGIYFKLLQIGEKNNKPKTGEFITFHISYYTGNDSLFFDAIRSIKYTPSTFSGDINECFGMLAESDSASFYISADNFFNKTINAPLPRFLPPSSFMKVNIKIISVKSAKQYQIEKQEFLSWVKDLGEYEQLALLNFIDKEQINVNPSKSGIYKIDIAKGTGKMVELKDTITVNYEGRFLNGKIFDSTKKRNEPFQFIFGTEMQVIKGLEESISKMRQGDHALFVMPSKMAFGENGSSSGTIPAYTSVIFDVELIEVK